MERSGRLIILCLREWHWDDYKTIPAVCEDYHNTFDKYVMLAFIEFKESDIIPIENKREPIIIRLVAKFNTIYVTRGKKLLEPTSEHFYLFFKPIL